MLLTAEFLVLGGKHKGLRNNVEVFEAVSLLHPLDVLIQTVFARQFIRPVNEQDLLVLRASTLTEHRMHARVTAMDRPAHHDSFRVSERQRPKPNALCSGSQQTHRLN